MSIAVRREILPALLATVRCLLSECEQLTSCRRFPDRGSQAGPALQLHRGNFRRDSPPRQGHRPAARRGQLPMPRLGRSRRASRGWHGLTTTSHGIRQVRNLCRSLLDLRTPIRNRIRPPRAGHRGTLEPSPGIHHEGSRAAAITPGLGRHPFGAGGVTSWRRV